MNTKTYIIRLSLISMTCLHPLWAQLQVTTTASRTRLGSPIGVSAQTSDTASWYRFRVHRIGEDFRMIRDFGPRQDLVWAATEHEGSYEMEITARNPVTGNTAVQYMPFEV